MQTVSVLSTFVLAMVLHPEVFKKAQAEMDAVVGADRLPTFEDRASLPYLECVVKEACRCMIFPLVL
jgi:cytochrome P450